MCEAWGWGGAEFTLQPAAPQPKSSREHTSTQTQAPSTRLPWWAGAPRRRCLLPTPRRPLLQRPGSSALAPSPLTLGLLVNDPSSLPADSRLFG